MNFGNCGDKHPNGYVNLLIDNTEKATTKDAIPFATKDSGSQTGGNNSLTARSDSPEILQVLVNHFGQLRLLNLI